MKKISTYSAKNCYADLLEKLTINCEQCCGLCCVALYYAKTDGFPSDKTAGIPCQNLSPDFRCAVHSGLLSSRLKGCMAYECLGAGQKVTQHLFPGINWRTNPEKAEQIYKAFLIVFEMHQMLWYLIEAFSIISDKQIKDEITLLISQNENITSCTPDELFELNIENYRVKVSSILKKVTELLSNPGDDNSNKDFIGKDFKKANLDGKNFSMSLLIAANLERCSLRGANFLGADMRDTNVKNTDLSLCIFLTQMQINTANGNKNTKLPVKLSPPLSWQK